MIRAFIALSISELLEKQLSLHAMSVSQQLPNEDLRWVPPENYHITLAFLGDIQSQAIPQIESLMAGVVASARISELAVDDIRWFPSIHKPRLLVASIEPQAQLLDLQSKLANSLRQHGFPVEGRQFKPHITLARAGRRQQAKKFQLALGELSTEMDEVVLFESQLRVTGPRYIPLAAMPIEG